MIPYAEFFRTATGFEPYPYQERLAQATPAVLEIPTGLGKTEATVLAWVYRRLCEPTATPRRLVYCLPMRSLVEQTRDRIQASFDNLHAAGITVPGVDIVMGGDVAENWLREPEKPYVVVGTQDMLLSRALNRGYGMSRFQWSMAFGALNNDAYWVVDEVQLQGIGAVTAAQLQAFRDRLGTASTTNLTLASATLDPTWFETADFTLEGKVHAVLDRNDLEHESLRAVARAQKRIERVSAYEPKSVASLALARHKPGTLTIVIVNRVGRAQEIYELLARQKPTAELTLLHSRYRPPERALRANELLASVDPAGPGRIVVATQVVEAGIDVSASTLITDVAPWAALVQRFGRCNRRGVDSHAVCIWLDGGDPTPKNAAPYVAADLLAAREALMELEGQSAAPLDLPKRPIPLRGGLVIRKPELFDLFDTSMDLAGHDVDVSPYIRDADDVGVWLFWRDEPPSARDVPQRHELCAAPLPAVRELLKALRASGHASDIRIANAFVSDPDHAWTDLHDSELRPGSTVWLRSDVGWYDERIGFAKVQKAVTPLHREATPDLSESCPPADSDMLSEIGVAITLTQHAQDTHRYANELAVALALAAPFDNILATAALWHDAGKAHPVFQETMHRANGDSSSGGTIWAKGLRMVRHSRRGFRHELPGALSYLTAHGEDQYADAVAFLIAAHHGKVRVATQPLPYEAPLEPFQLLGNRDGELLPEVDLGGGVRSLSFTIALDQFRVGTMNDTPAWVERIARIRDSGQFGIFRLAYLELLVRIADWRASAEEAKCRS